ncbi:phage tail protein [Sphingopyxis sp. QXT-31]|uniref:phage tail protein n=1 Tax=Sphingopyxis sp. QXT-31 TaxID=1357916 RepID=UPI0018DC00E6|nr:tail fiber protein [Sphingopyxis sp. QXT-31]
MRHLKPLALAAASGMAIAAASPAMAQQFFISQIIETGVPFCPRGFALAAGQILSIQQNTALFSLIGTTYGGNGVTTFQLPDIRGRMVVGYGQLTGGEFFNVGQVGGQQTVTLTNANLPAHSHEAVFQTANANTNDNKPFRNAFAVTPDNQYKTPPPSGPATFDGNLHPDTMAVQQTGTSGVPFPNMAPFLVTNYCIALQGIYPSRN